MVRSAFAAAASTSEKSWRTLFIVLASAVSIIMLYVSRHYGVTWDEWLEDLYGYFVLRNVLSFGQNLDYQQFAHNVLLKSTLVPSTICLFYGSFFTSLPEFMQNGLNQDTHLFDFLNFGHAVNAALGAMAMIYTGLFAKRLGTWRTAALALVMIALSPRFFGNSMNDPKDIPFAAAYIFSIYAISRFIQEWPALRLSTAIQIIIGFALAIGTRSAGGIIVFLYFFFFCGTFYLYNLWKKQSVPSPLKLLSFIIPVVLLGYIAGLIFWPYGRENLTNVLTALSEMSKYEEWNGSVLFEGALIPAKSLPWYYIPKWMAVSSPLFFVLSPLLWLAFGKRILKSFDAKLLFIISFAAFFPLAYVIAKKSILYDSWRHMLFIYPPLIVLAAAAWESLFESARSKTVRLAFCSFFCLLLLEPAVWMLRNHPHESSYFNATVGGTKGAFGNYETDYWGNSVRMAAEWLGNHHMEKNPGKTLIVRSDASVMSAYPFLRRIT